MGFLGRIKTSTIGIGNAIARGTGHIAGKATVETKEAAKITAVQADLAALDAEIETGYASVGKMIVEKILAGEDYPDFGAGPTLRAMAPKFQKRKELESLLGRLEKELSDMQILQERQIVQNEVDAVKAKLDKARSLGAITESDYSAMLEQANRKLVHFDEIRMLRKQKELGLITAAEFEAKVNALLS